MAHLSSWFKQALELEQPQPAKPLNEDIDADVAIIGGGYTGLWTAIMINQQAPKKHVVVLYKGMWGSGVSGASGGCVLPW
ncbi:FAD-dependent oxidoreductase, partial [Vibrio sp. 378]|uniref:FAD-dependent oxidoreductase n=1 Tax=Vibrio sp. 378 TaxID=3074603 RepID=UPI0029655BE2